MTPDDGSVVLLRERGPFANVRAAGLIFEHDAAAHEAERIETAHRLGDGAAADLLGAGRRFARIVERDLVADLPARVNATREPQLAIGLGEPVLTARGLPGGVVIRAGGE